MTALFCNTFVTTYRVKEDIVYTPASYTYTGRRAAASEYRIRNLRDEFDAEAVLVVVDLEMTAESRNAL